MARGDLDVHFARIDELVREINALVPSSNYREIQFRADLACLLVVAMAASYEACVKDTLFDFAHRQHAKFGNFTKNNYRKLNSRVQVKDLKRYCGLFEEAIKAEFNRLLSARKKRILDRLGRNIEVAYEQILTWRHDFAHAGIRNTTIEEAVATHQLAKRVLYVFDEAFVN